MTDPTLKESPFFPGKPVPPDLFTGREEEIELLKRKLQQASFGHNENVFVVGERGMGKSSLAGFVKELAAKKYGFYGVHCHLGGVKDIPGFARSVFQEMVRAATDETVFNSLKKLFEHHIRGISAFGVGVDFTNEQPQLQDLANNFLPAILEVHDKIKDRYKGILLIIDDLNGITAHDQFAHYIKSFVDSLATSGKRIPLVLLFAGLPERRTDMVRVQPSVARIFDIIELKPLSRDAGTEFFARAFGSMGVIAGSDEEGVNVDFFEVLSALSQGYPMLMHELGDSVFWADTDGILSFDDFLTGWRRAIVTIGSKYLEPDVLDSIKSEKYRNILTAIANFTSSSKKTFFTKTDLSSNLIEDDLRVFNNFISKVKKAGLIKIMSPGNYEFANFLYGSYIQMRFSPNTSKAAIELFA